ncbi:MAG: response regulator [Candidatus Nitrosocosmicus sp.]|nr:response regulator [Candidatus Nitrosocosmicus sp.]
MQKSILLVENDYELSRIFSTYLQAMGLNVATFSNPGEALQHFSSNMESYSIVLTDFVMEGMGGFEFAKEIKRLSGNGVPIIMLTGYSINDFATEEEIANTVTRVIIKPVSLKSLYTILSSYL